MIIEQGDFVLIPSAFDFTASSLEPPRGKRETEYVVLPNGEIRHGDPNGPPDVRTLVGTASSPPRTRACSSRSFHSSSTFAASGGSRGIILARLLEVLLIEALRSTAGTAASPGLLRGSPTSALASRYDGCTRARPRRRRSRSWQKKAAVSHSAFFERFSRAVGVAPLEYLLGRCMALAKNLLRHKEVTFAEVAQQVGYRSASTFSAAFTRHVRLPPTHYARKQAEPQLPMTSAEVRGTHVRLAGCADRSGNECFHSEALARATGEKEAYTVQYRTLWKREPLAGRSCDRLDHR